MFTRPIITFCVAAFAISWSIFAVGYFAGAFESQIGFGGVAFAFMWGPFLSAILCALIFDKGRITDSLAIKPKFNRWLIWSWLIPIVIAILSVAVTLLAPGISLSPWLEGLEAMMPGQDVNPLKFTNTQFTAIMILNAVIFGALINSFLLINEELGWRGYLWGKIIGQGFWKASLFTGVIWGFWHAPLIAMGHNYPGMPVAGIFLMVVFTTLLCPVIGYVRLKNGSVWGACVFHGTINAVATLTLISLSDASMPWAGIIGLGGMIILGLANIAVFFALKGNKVEGIPKTSIF